MKSMTCKQLGGACDQVFQADTFEEMAELSKQHGKEMYKAQDAAHLAAMGKMQALMQTPGAMLKWFMEKKSAFAALPETE
ncbi:MAG: DUF1059 domain-containing protein [Saprospiraceae bacterium]